MKKIITFIISVCILFTINAQTLDTAPWCPSGATWIYQLFAPFQGYYKSIEYEKDTIINNTVVKKMKIFNLDQFALDGPWYKTYTHNIYQYLSNDSLYQYNSQTNAFDFVFKFNATLADQIEVKGYGGCPSNHQNYPDSDTFTVANTGFDTLNGKIYSYIDYQSTTGYYDLGKVYNNIGGKWSPFAQVSNVNCPIIGMNQYLGLLCYYDDVRGYIFNSPTDTFCQKFHYLNVPSDYFKNNKYESNVTIFPNPSHTNFSIQINTPNLSLEDIQSVRLIDVQGKKITLASPSQNTFTIDFLPAGLYVVEIQYKNNIERVKLLKY